VLLGLHDEGYPVDLGDIFTAAAAVAMSGRIRSDEDEPDQMEAGSLAYV
jgi:hypothetical protein